MWREWLENAGLAGETDIVDGLFHEVLGWLPEMGIDLQVVPNAGATSNGYMLYPYLFYGCFADLPLPIYRELGVVARLYLSQIVLVDQALDGDLTTLREPWLAAQWILQQATRRLQHLLPPDSPFWADHAAIWRSYYAAMVRERRHTGRFLPYPQEEFLSTTAGIFAPAKVITAALGTLAGQRDRIAALHRSQDMAAAVDQVVDDLDDWRDDLKVQRCSFFLTSALERCAISDKLTATEKKVADVIFLQGFYEEFAQWGLRLCDEFEASAGEVGSPGWIWTAAALKHKLNGRRQAMGNVRRRLRAATGDHGLMMIK